MQSFLTSLRHYDVSSGGYEHVSHVFVKVSRCSSDQLHRRGKTPRCTRLPIIPGRSRLAMSSHAFRPHFFELYASERLTSTLRPALRYALELLSVRHPSLLPYASCSDLIFTSLALILDATHLSVHSGTISESFYGLRRARSFSPSAAPPLRQRSIAAALALSVLLDHAKLKLDAAYTARSSGSAAARRPLPAASASAESAGAVAAARRVRSLSDLAAVIRLLAARWRLRELFVKFYPAFNALYEGSGLLFNIAYLLAGTRYFSPSLMLQGLVIRRLTARELADADRPAAARGAVRPGPLAAGVGVALAGAKHLFVTGVFAFRFLEYYIAAEQRAPAETDEAIVPPPPEPLPPAPGVDPRAAASKVLCPICRLARVNAAACTASGYVFCYACIHSHLQVHRACPVTLMRATTDDILRVYEQVG